MTAYNAGQLVGFLLMALIAVGVVREIMRKRGGGDSEP